MKKIGLISDTHGFWDPQLYEIFHSCDEVWHAGDIGPLHTLPDITKLPPLKAVHGNIDDQETRMTYPDFLSFHMEDIWIWMVHIGGEYPIYTSFIKKKITKEGSPNLLITGHTHLTYAKKQPNPYSFLLLNPGAAGHEGHHLRRTIFRMTLTKGNVKDLELIDLGARGR